MRDALKRAMGEAPLSRIQQQFNQEVEHGGLIQRESHAAIGRSFTTDEMIALERDNIRLMRDEPRPISGAGQQQNPQPGRTRLPASQQQSASSSTGDPKQPRSDYGAGGSSRSRQDDLSERRP